MVLVVSLGLCVWPARAQAVSSFGGEATGVQVFVPATGTIIKAATGQLPSTGGQVNVSLVSGNIPGSATGGVVSLVAGTLHSVVVGLDATRAEASLANVSLTVSGNGFTADFMMARSAASCPGPTLAGSLEIPNLVINGQTINVTGDPNQTVSLPNGTAVINEQTQSIVGSSGQLAVTALHVTTRDNVTGQLLADVKLAIADAQIDCQPGSGPAGQFMTGGGWITGETTGKGTFGVVGGTDSDGSPRGHLVYIDHGTPSFTVQSTTILTFTPGCPSTIAGQGSSNVGSVTFTVTLQDKRDPGVGFDTFTIHADGPAGFTYTAGGVIEGGNIQAHRVTCP
jgi:hypothetical protein